MTSTPTLKLLLFIVCLFHGMGNGNEIHVYLAKCNWGMRMKCVGLTQFGNKECESHSHGGVGNENEGIEMEYMFTFVSL